MALPMQHLSTNIVPFLTGALPETSQFNCVSGGSVLSSFHLLFSRLPILTAALKKKRQAEKSPQVVCSDSINENKCTASIMRLYYVHSVFI